MMKGLMNRCVSQVTVVDRLRAKAEAMVAKLREAWKVVQENKIDLTKKLLEEVKMQTKALKKVLKDKEEEISNSKKYCDSGTLLAKLGGSFADNFNDCLRQVKASFPDLDLSHVTINAKGQTPTRPTDSIGTDELFGDDITDPQVDKEADPQNEQIKSYEEEFHPLERSQKDEETLVDP